MELIYVIPCGAEKAGDACKARDLYIGAMFRNTLAAAEASLAKDIGAGCAESGRILILSAKHGLLELDQIVEPYDCKMGDADSIDAAELVFQLADMGINEESSVWGMLPTAYHFELVDALEALGCDLNDVYESARTYGADRGGIGHQRAVNRSIALPLAA